MTTPTATCIVLAAGASTRMGAPKALTRIGSESAVTRIVRVARECGLAEVVVVTRAGVALPPLDARVVVNATPDAGRTGSLQRGLDAARAVVAALAWPVDHPLASAASVRALLAARDEAAAWIVPEHEGRGGHPVLLRADAIAAVRRAASDAPLRDALAKVPQARVRVDDAGVLANLDSPADLANWLP